MKRFLTAKFTALLLAAVLLVGCSAPAWAYTVQNNWVRVGVTAGETLTRGDLVAIKAADGLAYKADADDATLRPAVGIIGTGGATGVKVEVVVTGKISGFTGLTPGALAYLSGTAGAATQAAPVWAQPVGLALSATELYCNFSNYVDATGLTGLMPSTLAANAPDVAASVWGVSNGLKAEGATADAVETSVAFADPTVGDQTWNHPDLAANTTLAYFGTTLTTNAPEVANSVWGISTGLKAEGATADAVETSVIFADPSVGDQTWTHPDLAANTTLAYLGTTLTTNAPEVANSVWGISNGLKAEGATADAHATTVTFTDPTGTRTATFPDASGTVDLAVGGAHDYAGAAADWSMTVAEAQASYIAATNANGAVNAILPAATAGKIRTVYNNTGQVLTFKVTGQAGGTVATGKYAIYTDNGTDVVEIYEQP